MLDLDALKEMCEYSHRNVGVLITRDDCQIIQALPDLIALVEAWDAFADANKQRLAFKRKHDGNWDWLDTYHQMCQDCDALFATYAALRNPKPKGE